MAKESGYREGLKYVAISMKIFFTPEYQPQELGSNNEHGDLYQDSETCSP